MRGRHARKGLLCSAVRENRHVTVTGGPVMDEIIWCMGAPEFDNRGVNWLNMTFVILFVVLAVLVKHEIGSVLGKDYLSDRQFVGLLSLSPCLVRSICVGI